MVPFFLGLAIRTAATGAICELLRQIFQSGKPGEVEQAILALPGGSTASSPAELMKCLDRWVLVAMGPEALGMWRTTTSAADNIPAWHGGGVCFNCLMFSVSGFCPHLYACYIDAGRRCPLPFYYWAILLYLGCSKESVTDCEHFFWAGLIDLDVPWKVPKKRKRGQGRAQRAHASMLSSCSSDDGVVDGEAEAVVFSMYP